MPLIQRKGAQSSQGFGEFSSAGVNPNAYIENLFSTWLYTGNASTQTITNGIDLAGKGGLVWTKARSAVIGSNHALVDTVTGAGKYLVSATTAAQGSAPQGLTSFTSSGYNLGVDGYFNDLAGTYVGWTFRKQAKFFDIVTYTGNGGSGSTVQTINHNLGSVPGAIILKKTNNTSNWVYGSSALDATWGSFLLLNTTGAVYTQPTYNRQFAAAPTSTTFSVTDAGAMNSSGDTYVAYIFASNAGGFGSDGTQNVISCGSFTTASNATATITLGYEPQWVIVKRTDSTSPWYMLDNMRGWVNPSPSQYLQADQSAVETNGGILGYPTATGFVNAGMAVSATFIYIAIRRGPMKTPTVGTSVFEPNAYIGNGASNRIIGSLNAGDSALVFTRNYSSYSYPQTWWSRLTGGYALRPFNTNAEVDQSTTLGFANQTGQLISIGSTNINYSGAPAAGSFSLYNFRRAPGFFDVVCYTATSGTTTYNHNLTVIPELVIEKERNSVVAGDPWYVSYKSGATYRGLYLNTPGSSSALGTPPVGTSTQWTTQVGQTVSGATYVSYLFASCPGVSKIGSYTGTGATQTINCGFAGGARFVLIKRTDSTGDWYVWDTARGMVSGTDPYVLMNVTGDEVNANNVYTTGVGFQIVGTGAGINASGGTYIYLAIA